MMVDGCKSQVRWAIEFKVQGSKFKVEASSCDFDAP